MDPGSLIHRERYPIDEPAHPLRTSTIGRVRADLSRDGCAVLDGFLSRQGLETILGEAAGRRSQAYFAGKHLTNAYFTRPDPALPTDHPVNILMPRTNGFITADLFGPETDSRRLYDWPPLAGFLAECLGKPELFIYEDPVSNMIVNVGTPGAEFTWHFDTNEYTITMLLRAACSGGHFEYVPGIRSMDDEHYGEVREVLAGRSDRIRRLKLKPGDLQIFLGRYALHRVTENTGEDDRLLIIMSFSDCPGVIGSKERVRQLYGKTMPVHEERRIRSDRLLD